VLYDFKQSWFYCRAYILQTYVKLAICGLVLGWSLMDQCNLLRESFKTEFECKVEVTCLKTVANFVTFRYLDTLTNVIFLPMA